MWKALRREGNEARTVKRNGRVYRYELDPPRRYYRCSGKGDALPRCRERLYISAEQLEDLVWAEVMRIVQGPEFIKAAIDSVMHSEDGQQKERLAQADRELQAVEAQNNRAVTLYVNGKISEEQLDDQRGFIAERMEPLRAKRDECLGQVAAAAKAYDISRCTEQVMERLETLSLEERKRVMVLLLDHLTIDGQNGVSITLAVPVKIQVGRETGPGALDNSPPKFGLSGQRASRLSLAQFEHGTQGPSPKESA